MCRPLGFSQAVGLVLHTRSRDPGPSVGKYSTASGGCVQGRGPFPLPLLPVPLLLVCAMPWWHWEGSALPPAPSVPSASAAGLAQRVGNVPSCPTLCPSTPAKVTLCPCVLSLQWAPCARASFYQQQGDAGERGRLSPHTGCAMSECQCGTWHVAGTGSVPGCTGDTQQGTFP